MACRPGGTSLFPCARPPSSAGKHTSGNKSNKVDRAKTKDRIRKAKIRNGSPRERFPRLQKWSWELGISKFPKTNPGSSYPSVVKEPDRPTSSFTEQTTSTPAASTLSNVNQNTSPQESIGHPESSPRSKSISTWPLRKKDVVIGNLNALLLKPIESGSIEPDTRGDTQIVSGRDKDAGCAPGSTQLITNRGPMPRKKYSPEEMTIKLKAVHIQKNSTVETRKESSLFVQLWEVQLLPALKAELRGIKGCYSINVLKGEKPGQRIIDIMTSAELAEEMKAALECQKDRYLPDNMKNRTVLEFTRGEIQFSSISDTAS
ncbi:uncharacterized protein BCR38DRAFT_482770 [Pseudomassariella vexata]|uniref:Uncharacterized protein n=1 Tax=Pseudomassariella vexata TaxID=1141098 RepID=A0A1Y2E6F4_9PEZI|nr:uncharacterized protein BCR38DRAFT_482770 [Pseudomassariella vexata]ORY67131.1 hypothetical protein BCR38DRAFT_482770 [Pseudomassariella vexata]